LDSFFLLGGTVLFFAGLACLILVFTSIARRLRTSVNSSVYFRSKGSYRDAILAGVGIALIVSSQGFFWFHGEIEKFIPFEESVPEMRISFLYEEYRTPRIIVQSTDQHQQVSAQMVPLEGDRISVGVEVLKWGQLGRLLGLKECYRINGIYYLDSATSNAPTPGQVPDYALNGGPSGFVSASEMLGKLFPADMRVLMSQPMTPDGRAQYFLQITPVIIFSSRMVDNRPVASYPK
jgi:hypothetical protein